jgi:hypothetical protein
MSEITYAQAHHLALMQARATVAAALIQNGEIKISALQFITEDPKTHPSFTSLKGAVDKVMIAIGAQLV